MFILGLVDGSHRDQQSSSRIGSLWVIHEIPHLMYFCLPYFVPESHGQSSRWHHIWQHVYPISTGPRNCQTLPPAGSYVHFHRDNHYWVSHRVHSGLAFFFFFFLPVFVSVSTTITVSKFVSLSWHRNVIVCEAKLFHHKITEWILALNKKVNSKGSA